MVMHYSTENNEAGIMPTPAEMEAIGQLMGEYASSGVLLSGEGVHPSSKGARIEFSGGDTRVIDGPFAEAKELIAGFAILEVKSREEAVEMAKRFAAATGAPRIDVRQVVEFSDFE